MESHAFFLLSAKHICTQKWPPCFSEAIFRCSTYLFRVKGMYFKYLRMF
jgi:hypothetical protein